VPSQALIRTSRLYAEMRNAEAYGARTPQGIEVDFPLAMARMRRIRARAGRVDSAPRIAAAGIDLFFGTARFVGVDAVEVDGLRLRFKKALIATGSRSLLPTIPGLDEAGYLTNETLFDLTALPKSLLVIGGGPVGCQVAQASARRVQGRRASFRPLLNQSTPLAITTHTPLSRQVGLDAEAILRKGRGTTAIAV